MCNTSNISTARLGPRVRATAAPSADELAPQQRVAKRFAVSREAQDAFAVRSHERALAVRRWLLARKLPPERLVIRSYGTAEPTGEGTARDRRVTLRLID